VRGRIGVNIRLDFDQPAADAVDQENHSDEVGGDLVNVAAEKGACEWLTCESLTPAPIVAAPSLLVNPALAGMRLDC
jgi:hypothetical protein